MKKENKVKKFWDKNKGKIFAVTGWLVALGTVTVVVVNSIGSDETEEVDNTDYDNAMNSKDVDEDIFTNLAPQIEDMVLTEGLDEGYIEETYSVDYPKNGDSDESYTVDKKVEIKVYDVTE